MIKLTNKDRLMHIKDKWEKIASNIELGYYEELFQHVVNYEDTEDVEWLISKLETYIIEEESQ